MRIQNLIVVTEGVFYETQLLTTYRILNGCCVGQTRFLEIKIELEFLWGKMIIWKNSSCIKYLQAIFPSFSAFLFFVSLFLSFFETCKNVQRWNNKKENFMNEKTHSVGWIFLISIIIVFPCHLFWFANMMNGKTAKLELQVEQVDLIGCALVMEKYWRSSVYLDLLVPCPCDYKPIRTLFFGSDQVPPILRIYEEVHMKKAKNGA